jgi:hypothetical protein
MIEKTTIALAGMLTGRYDVGQKIKTERGLTLELVSPDLLTITTRSGAVHEVQINVPGAPQIRLSATNSGPDR